MDDLSYVDIEKLAREAELIEPSDVWADLPADYTRSLSRLAALLLEKAAQVCEGMHEEDRPGDYADAIRSMAAGMGE